MSRKKDGYKPTMMQERIADALVENTKLDRPLNRKEILLKAGYSEKTAKAVPSAILNQEGVRTALAARGFTVEAADDVVAEILHKREAKDNDRLKAADMIYDRLGAKAPEKSVSVAVSMDSKDFAEYEKLANKYDEEMRAKLLE